MPPSKRIIAAKVFLDANVVIRAGKPPGKPIMDGLADLVTSGLIRIVTTDLTKIEVAKKHTNNDLEQIAGLGRKRFRQLVKHTIDVDLPEISAEDLHRKIFDRYLSGIEGMFKRLKATTLSIDTVKPSAVFESYTHKTGLFAGEAKKDQFPDAFIFEALKAEAQKDAPLIVVSDDGDFATAISQSKHVSRLRSIGALFEHLGLKSEAAPDVEEFLEANTDEVVDVVDTAMNNWGLQISDVEDAEVDESTVKKVEFLDLVTYNAASGGGQILVVGRLKMEVDVSYTHPDWDTAMYDSEDKVYIPFDNVSGEKEVELEADFSMIILVDDEGKPEQIDHFSFSNDSFIWVSISPSDEDYR